MPKRRRKSKSKKSKQKYIPIVVLNNQIPSPTTTSSSLLAETRSIPRRRIRRPLQPKNLFYYWDPRPRVPDNLYASGFQSRYGMLDPIGSSSSMMQNIAPYGSGASSSVSKNGFGHMETLIFLAALAASVFFLNRQIDEAKDGRKRKKRGDTLDDSFEIEGTLLLVRESET